MSSGPAPSDIVREAAEQDSKTSVEVIGFLSAFLKVRSVCAQFGMFCVCTDLPPQSSLVSSQQSADSKGGRHFASAGLIFSPILCEGV